MTEAIAIGKVLLNITHEYQTLIAGLIAIAAAFITVRPVWRQLEYMRVETNSIYRDFLADRIKAIGRQRKWLADYIETFDNDVRRQICEVEESNEKLNSEWAFNQEQSASRFLDALTRYRDEGRHSPVIVEGVILVIAKLTKLRDTFDAIHRPQSMNQSSEDCSMSNEEWASLGKAGQEAERNLAYVAHEFSASVDQLTLLVADELRSLRKRASEIDQALLQLRR